jgi:TorA maturation chaperone TorD
MHFLCFQEVEMTDSDGDALSFQLAQSDFSERHLCNWVSELAERIIEKQPDALYGKLIAALSEFLVKDFEWQASTIESS